MKPIPTWRDYKIISNGQWPDDECMKNEIDALRYENEKLRELMCEAVTAIFGLSSMVRHEIIAPGGNPYALSEWENVGYKIGNEMK